MSWRTVVISGRCKLDLKMGYMVIRAQETRRIFLDEIAILLIEDPAVALTGCLLEALVQKKVRVIFCDGRHSPMAELTPYHGAHDCAQKIKLQTAWSDTAKGSVWAAIVREKIGQQALLLQQLDKRREAGLLRAYLGQIAPNDSTNREGHAAKVYFNALFGMEFVRGAPDVTNAALNYGYSILLSAFNREVAACGYLTQLGIFHSNMFNPYNLSCDLMEPFRVLVDRAVKAQAFTTFASQEKHCLWALLGAEICMDGTRQTVLNAIKIYTHSVFDALQAGDAAAIKTYVP